MTDMQDWMISLIALAGAVLCMIIPIIFFVIFQSYMVKGLTKGAVKG